MSEIERAIILMRRHKITQREVAAQAGYTEDWVSMILREKAVSESAVMKIVNAIETIIKNRTA